MADQEKELKEFDPKDRLFDRIVFGHPLYGFDRDQAVTYYIALVSGLITPGAPVQFASEITDDTLNDTRTLVIEGFSNQHAIEIKDFNKTSNFTNDPVDDNPAAAMLFNAYQARINTMEKAGKLLAGTFQKIQDLKNWLAAVERYKIVPTPNKLNPKDLAAFSEIFNAIKFAECKEPGDKAGRTLGQVKNLFDRIFNTQRTTALEEPYSTQIKSHETDQKEKLKRFQEHVLLHDAGGQETGINPQFLRTTQTLGGLQVAYVDVRDEKQESIERGTFGLTENILKRFNYPQPNIMMLVNYERDDKGEISGTQIKIKVQHNDENDPRLKDLRELAERLSLSEHLFGQGLQGESVGNERVKILQTTNFDGHELFIGAPAWKGSHMDPEAVYIALQEYLNADRYPTTLTEKEQKEPSLEKRRETWRERAFRFAQEISGLNPRDRERVEISEELPKHEFRS